MRRVLHHFIFSGLQSPSASRIMSLGRGHRLIMRPYQYLISDAYLFYDQIYCHLMLPTAPS